MLKVNAYALKEKGAEKLTPFSYELGPLKGESTIVGRHGGFADHVRVCVENDEM